MVENQRISNPVETLKPLPHALLKACAQGHLAAVGLKAWAG